MRIKLYNNLLKCLLPAVSLLWAVSCTDEIAISSSTDTDLGNEPVMVRATTMDTGAATRAGDAGPFEGENTPIRGRTMLFTYPSQPNGKMKSAYCVFDDAGIGYVYANMDKSSEPLRWKDICTGLESYPAPAEDAVFLDNLVNYPVEDKEWLVPGSSENKFNIDFFTRILTCEEQPSSQLNPRHKFGQNPETSFISAERDKYNFRFRQMIAPVGHEEAEEVDIIWGKIATPTPNKSLHFELEHKMSAISFRFYTDNDELEEELAGATDVWLDKMCIWLENSSVNSQYNTQYTIFNRKKGAIYGEETSYWERNYTNEDFHLIDANASDRPQKLEKQSGNEGITYYSTPVWIVPPYKWLGTAIQQDRPKLSICLPDGTVYSGILPENINYWDYNTQKKEWVLMNGQIRFWKGRHLSFKVKLNKEEGERVILFEGITVEPFVRQLEDSPELKQSGIYSGEELATLAQTYNDNSDSDNLRLIRYGYFDGEKWVFPLWSEIKIPDDQNLPTFNNDRFEIVGQSETFKIFYKGKEVTKGDLAPQS